MGRRSLADYTDPMEAYQKLIAEEQVESNRNSLDEDSYGVSVVVSGLGLDLAM